MQDQVVKMIVKHFLGERFGSKLNDYANNLLLNMKTIAHIQKPYTFTFFLDIQFITLYLVPSELVNYEFVQLCLVLM